MSTLRKRKKDLNNPNKPISINRVTLSKYKSNARDSWKRTSFKNTGVPFLRTLIVSFAFFIFALLVGLVVYVFDLRPSINSDNIIISIKGPATIDSGKESPLFITVSNTNPVPIMSAFLVVRYPEGTRDSANLTLPLNHERILLGRVDSGASISKQVTPVFFGSVGEMKELTVSFEYRIEGARSLFTQDKDYIVEVKNSPLSISVEGLREVVAGKETQFRVVLNSNTNRSLENIIIEAKYPFGFFPTYTSLQSDSQDKTRWSIPSISPGSSKQIIIQGIPRGLENQKQAITLRAYIPAAGNNTTQVLVASGSFEFALGRPFFVAQIMFEGKEGNPVNASTNERVTARLRWQNTTPEVLKDVNVELKINGDGLLRNTVSVDEGFYNSETNVISWDKNTSNRLSSVSPGQSGFFNFAFTTIPSNALGDLTEREVLFNVDVTAERTGQSSRETARNILAQSLRLRSNVSFAANTLYRSSQFENTGPLPPKVGFETTYTISLLFQNNGNSLEDVRAEFTLPVGVKWVGDIYPSFERNVTYDEDTRQVLWDIGSVSSVGSGSRRELELRVSITPQAHQRGRILTLTNGIIFEGKDLFTKENIRVNRKAQTTQIDETGNTREVSGVVE